VRQAAIVGVVLFFSLITAYYLLRKLRHKHKDPKYIPTQFLKKRWLAWEPHKVSSSRSNNDHLEPIAEAGRDHNGRQAPANFDAATANAIRHAGGGVDRNTSVRSVMTLPAYNPKAGDTEQVLGREGERGGIDVVIEYPEDEIISEQRRDEEMEALYQVRLARRTEAQDREERRRLRREARDRNDWVALEELRTRGRASSGSSNIDSLRAEHDRIRARERAVSSVSYGDLGVARHDGTRIRANSEESERPLLGDAASIAASSRHHRRDRSASSVLSINTMDSDFPSPRLPRSITDSRPESPGMGRPSGSGNMSSPELIDVERDLGDDGIPGHSPPEYEDITLEDGREAPPEYFVAADVHESDLVAQPASATVPSGGEDTVETLNSAPMRDDRRISRGVGGVPQLPSLRLANLPSIIVDTGTPTAGPRSEEGRPQL
jgi:hypothetical protein